MGVHLHNSPKVSSVTLFYISRRSDHKYLRISNLLLRAHEDSFRFYKSKGMKETASRFSWLNSSNSACALKPQSMYRLLPLCQLLLLTIFQAFITRSTTPHKIEHDNFVTDPVLVSKLQLLVELIELCLNVAEIKVCSVHLKLESVVV